MTIHFTAPPIDLTETVLSGAFVGNHGRAARLAGFSRGDADRIVADARAAGFYSDEALDRLVRQRVREGLALRASLYLEAR